ncbi:MAG TPA: hypothetical protein VNR68_10030 [Sphingomicrobium sp.]|nr:hypothetical protein [Sphingomicrobium sp.]
MSGGEYLLGLILIITGLAISDMVVSLHGVLIHRKAVKWDWIALLAAAYIFLMIVNSWGLSFQTFNRNDANPYLWEFLELLGQIIALYLAARASLPDVVPDSGLDLAAYYSSISRYFWTAIAATLALYLAGGAYLEGDILPFLRDRWGAAAQLALMIPLILSRNRRLHCALVPVIVAIFCLDHLDRRLFG